jgi:hypothetical protein
VLRFADSLETGDPAGPRIQTMLRSRILWIAVGIAVAIVVLLGLISSILVDWAWFTSLGFESVFITVLGAKLALFATVFAISAAVLWVNGAVAARAFRARNYLRPANSPWAQYESNELPAVIERFVRRLPWNWLVAVAAIVVGLFVALGSIDSWSLVLGWANRSGFGQVEPLFGNDLGFYVFTLPLLVAIKGGLVVLVVLSAILSGAVYWSAGEIVLEPQGRRFSGAALTHGSVLLGGFFVVEAFGYWLDRYDLLYGDNGVVVGAGFTDVHIRLPLLILLVILSLAAAAASIVNVRARNLRIPVISLVAVFGTSFFLSPLAAALVERVYVKPNQLQFETPYIRNNIALTREAYDLNRVEVKPFSDDQTLTAQSLEDDRGTIDNIRLWDWQPLLASYAQLQEIRTYYKFHDADIDRYTLNGKDQQVMLSARELETSMLLENAQTWVNLHLLYTHGNGVVMSPVTRATSEGLPVLYLQDIPPLSTGGPPIAEPRIYFGESDSTYAIVKGTTPEFDYPKGSDNVYRSYDGADGVGIGSLARRLLFAWNLGDLNILLSEYLTPQSKILIRRNIQERVSTIAPFLTLDHDPYIVVSGGRLFWIQDAYTATNWFPYAQPLSDNSADYVRNSVKIVIDAYNGTVDFYVADPKDPIVSTWQRIFPAMFKPFDAMPADLRAHVRYPEDLFQIQADIYRTYHMSAPEVFYNREDLWQFPRQPNDLEDDSSDTKMQPYYINMRLPGESRTEFILMLPMVPASRENMIAWLAGRCDPANYGKLIAYEFPKEKLIYGPYQIAALINQNTEVSQQLTLWNQSGSRVLRGNLLVVPVGNSLLYVMPLYLRAQSGQLPELKRVIAVYGDRVVMEETLPEALAALFKLPEGASQPAETPAQQASSTASGVTDRAGDALAHYNAALAKLKAGDWAGFGAELDALRPILEQMSQKAPAKPAH